jgi:integrase/recombinase XerD
MKPAKPTALACSLRSFLSEHLPSTRGLSPHTVRSYRDAFVLLLPFLAERHSCTVVDLDFDHLGPRDLLAFLDHLESDRGVCISTRNSRLAAVRSFARFVATGHPECLETCQRLLAVPTKRGQVRTVEYLEGDEIRAILESTDREKSEGRRDHALLLTLFNTGARVQELLGVRPTDLQLDKPFQVRLRGKGRKERICPLWTNTVESLRKLLSDIPDQASETKPIFRNRRGEPMTRFGVRYIVRRYAERAQVAVPRLANKRVHPHTFRHSAAVHLLRSGVDFVTISHWLGHASLETTNRYATIDLETKRQALERAGPIGDDQDPLLKSWRTDRSLLDWLEAL